MNEYKIALLVLFALIKVLAFGHAAHAQIPGGCTEHMSQETDGIGCWLIATETLETLPQAPLFWHLHTYPTRQAAETVKTRHGTIVESFGKIWILTIAEETWKATQGGSVARIGPLPIEIETGKPYVARYMQATFAPGKQGKGSAHRHSGPEAWYLVSGAQCLETPEGITITREGEGAVVKGGPAMMLSMMGEETRRALVLVLHDAAQRWSSLAPDWQPKGLCPQ
jgi:hypothetical protein